MDVTTEQGVTLVKLVPLIEERKASSNLAAGARGGRLAPVTVTVCPPPTEPAEGLIEVMTCSTTKTGRRPGPAAPKAVDTRTGATPLAVKGTRHVSFASVAVRRRQGSPAMVTDKPWFAARSAARRACVAAAEAEPQRWPVALKPAPKPEPVTVRTVPGSPRAGLTAVTRGDAASRRKDGRAGGTKSRT